MRAALVATLVAVAAAAPAVTYTEVVDVYTTVWDDGSAAETPAPTADSGSSWGGWGHWGHGHGGWGKPSAPAASPVEAAPETTPDYTADWTPAATPAATPDSYTPAAAPASGSGESTSSDYNTAVVQHHNAHRANHSAPDLTWDDGLASTALKIAKSCVYAHDVTTDGGGYGQNIAAGAPASNISSVITELFYNNEVNNFAGLYGQATPSNINDEKAFDGWGHFSQIVWKGTTSVGCATYDCSAQGLANTGSNTPAQFTVCNYKPAGNFLGEFASNVGASLNQPSISWAST